MCFHSRIMSPEVPAGPEAFLHQRTQSMDSMSSGHSSGSGSGSGSGNIDTITGRRRITVKPLDEPDDEEIPSYKMRSDICVSAFSILCISVRASIYIMALRSCVIFV